MPFADTLPPGALEGYALPVGDGSERNRRNLRRAMKLLSAAGWEVRDGKLRNGAGRALEISVLLRQGDSEMKTVVQLYARALERLGITLRSETVDNAQYVARQNEYDFDMTRFRRALSLSPGTEQRLYWGSAGYTQPGTRNLMGVNSPAVDSLIDTMLSTQDAETFTAAVRALDRVLTAGRYVIPIWQFDKGRIAHVKELKHPARLPLYGDGIGFMPEVWWYEE
jgi:peptide/nickel transport system substrate-binding protein